MKAVVIHESVYGNTAEIARTIADSLRLLAFEVSAGSISTVAPEETVGFDLLVAGGPTHAHGMSRASTRKAGATDTKNLFKHPTVDPGLREWLDGLPEGSGRLAAAFDTRFDKPVLLTGSAAKGIARRLERRGYQLIAGPESFFVTTDNTLVEGQSHHAEKWAAGLADRAAASARTAASGHGSSAEGESGAK